MASKTAVQLIQELGQRLGEFALFTSTNTGTTTQITAAGLDTYIPALTAHVGSWIWCLGGANIGLEARASSYAPSTHLLTLLSPGFTNATETAVQYEVHARTRRSRKLEALNSAIRQLGLYWPREVIDTSLTTLDSTWGYALPSGTNWADVTRVQVQMTTDTSLVGYPYWDDGAWDWSIRRSESSVGAETWTLQFTGGSLPPVGRLIRVTGHAYFSDLAADADVLPIGSLWGGKALDWIYDWAKYRILDETVERQPGGEAERYRQRAIDKLNQAKEDLILNMRPRGGNRIATPFSGSSAGPGGINLGLFASQSLAREFS